MGDEGSGVTRRGFLGLGASLALGFLNSACTPVPMGERPRANLNLAAGNRTLIRAERFEIREDWTSPMAPSNVEHLMPLSPMQAVRLWAENRLGVTGETGHIARLAILDASVSEKRLAVEGGVKGKLISEQSERFDATLDAILELVDTETGITVSQAAARVTRFITIGEESSLEQRDLAWVELIESLMRDFDQRMSEAIRAYMGRHISP